VLQFLFNFLIGAFVGASLLAPFGRKALHHFFPIATAKLFYRPTTAMLALSGGILGAKFNVAEVPNLLLDMAFIGNPFAIVAVGTIMVLCIIAITRLIAGGRTS